MIIIQCVFLSVCEDPFTKEESKSSSGGAGQDDVTTINDCKDVCRDDDDCVGFDWTLDDEADTRCWLHTDIKKLEDNDDNDGADQYTRGECTEGKTTLVKLYILFMCIMLVLTRQG